MTGLEPVRCRQRWILSPLRLPIPSHRQVRGILYTIAAGFASAEKIFWTGDCVGVRYIRISLQAHSPDRLFILCRSAGDTLFDILLLQHDRAGYARVFKDRSAHGVHGADHRHGVPAEHAAGKVLHPWSLPHLYFASRCGIALRRPDTGMAQQDLDREAVNAKPTVRHIRTA